MVKQYFIDIRRSGKWRKQCFEQYRRKTSVDAKSAIALLHVSFYLEFIQSHRRSTIPTNYQLVRLRWQLLRDFFDGLIQNACPASVFYDNFVLDLRQIGKLTFSILFGPNIQFWIGIKLKINY